MKILIILLILTLFAGCDPYNFGFKHNPAWVLDIAFQAVMNQDQEQLLTVTGKEALCLYGNAEGVTYLKEKIFNDVNGVKLKHKVLSEGHFQVPEFVGFWSYFRKRFKIEILEKNSDESVLEAIVDCDFGTPYEKDEKLENQSWTRYKSKECRLVKVLPHKFEPLPLNERCELLKVDL